MDTSKSTPGVYVKEISTLPPSVAEVATAIPAFIGYTQFANDNAGKNVGKNVPRRISNMLEYDRFFGKAMPSAFIVETTGDIPEIVTRDSKDNYILYYAMQLYFSNGGGPCYVVSIGGYDPNGLMEASDFTDGLKAIAKVDEPTLLLAPEAIYLGLGDLKVVYGAALDQCKNLQDRFAIMDVPDDEEAGATNFRGSVPAETDFLKYGAAYMPFLKTAIPYAFDESGISVKAKAEKNFSGTITSGVSAKLSVTYTGTIAAPKIQVVQDVNITKHFVDFDIAGTTPDTLIIKIKETAVDADIIITAWESVTDTGRKGFDIIGVSGDIVPFDNPVELELRHKSYELTVPNNSGTSLLSITCLQLAKDPAPVVEVEKVASDKILEITPAFGRLKIVVPDGTTGSAIKDAWILIADTNREGFDIALSGSGNANFTDGENAMTLSTILADKNIDTAGQLEVEYTGSFREPKVTVVVDLKGDPVVFVPDPVKELLTIIINQTKMDGAAIQKAWEDFVKAKKDAMGFLLKSVSGEIQKTSAQTLNFKPANSNSNPPPSPKLDTLKDSQTTLYNNVKQAVAKERLTLPPSAAMAGIYARVDRDRGVWKSPANVSVLAVTEPTIQVTAEVQAGLNIDVNAGKSINVIRSFTGKGILVWGARTLAGNDNEWRYISVRRLFNMIEESVQKSTAFAVFEPNDAGTWLKVKAMIDSYLYGLWQQGALAGSTPDQAYFVNVGLGKTMTTQDILEGRMNVEIGLAAVRPAEFIILKFSHKLQEA